MAELYLARLSRLHDELLPYGFIDGKYGDAPYEEVEWNGVVTQLIDFGFNIFVDSRLIATAVSYKDGRFVVEMLLGQWMQGRDPNSPLEMDADYRAAVARRALAISSRRHLPS